jgi:hypothetical protein
MTPLSNYECFRDEDQHIRFVLGPRVANFHQELGLTRSADTEQPLLLVIDLETRRRGPQHDPY